MLGIIIIIALVIFLHKAIPAPKKDEKKGKKIEDNPWHITDKPQYNEWKKGWYVSRKHANMAKESSQNS